MKPKGRRGRNSTSFSPTETSTAKKNDPKSRRSLSVLKLHEIRKSQDEDLFDKLMNDPVKKALVLKMISDEKDNIERYKRKEQKKLEDKTSKRLVNPRLHCESPTALFRRRALEKLRRDSDSSFTSSSKSTTPPPTPSPVPFSRLLEGVIAYIEIRNKEGDCSAGARALMQSMGATVLDRFDRRITHVVFKDGSFNTYQRARLMKVHLVSVLWLEETRKHHCRAPEKNFPALGTEAYDVNISQICQDYEDVVRAEYRRSLAIGSASKGRKTGVPSELKRTRGSSEVEPNTSDSFHTAGELHEVVPSSQDWELESVIMSEKDFPPFRRPIPMVSEDDSDRLTSDTDSESGVVNGHSIRQIRDSLICDLNVANEYFEENARGILPVEDRQSINIVVNTNEQSNANTSSNRSVSLLSRKSVPGRKSSYSIVDMDLTNKDGKVNDMHPNKENLKSGDGSTESNEKVNKSVNDMNKQTVSLESKGNVNKRKTIGVVNDLTNNLEIIPVNNVVNSSLRSDGSTTRSLSEILLNEINLSDGITHEKQKCPNTENLVGNKRTLKRKSQTSNADEPKENSLNTIDGSLRTSIDDSGDRIGNMKKKRSSKRYDKSVETEAHTKEDSLASENIPSLRVSTESARNDFEKQKHKRSLRSSGPSTHSEDVPSLRISAGSSENTTGEVKTASDDVEKQKYKRSLRSSGPSTHSEDVPSLRISAGSSENTTAEVKSGRVTRNSSHKSVLSEKDKEPNTTESNFTHPNLQHSEEANHENPSDNANGKPVRSPNKKKGHKDSLNSEDLPPLRISSESLTKTKRSLESQKNSRAVSVTDQSLEVNLADASKLKSTSAISTDSKSFNSQNFSPVDEVIISNIIASMESPPDERGGGDPDISGKSNKIQKGKQKPLKEKVKEDNKKGRKLYNLNQSIGDTIKCWESNNVYVDSQLSQPIMPTKILTVPLTPVLLTKNATKLLKIQNVKPQTETSPRKQIKGQKRQPILKPNKKVQKPTAKTNLNESKDEQKELTKEYVAKEKPLVDVTPRRKRKNDEDDEQKVTAKNLRRRSQRLLSQNQKTELPIVPDLNRRSTLEFVKPIPPTQRKLSQKKKKTKPTIVCTRMHKPEVQTFIQIVKKLGRFIAEDEVNDKTTHLVVGESRRTINLLRAIARGCWIVKKEWLYRSLEAGKWLPEEEHEVTDFTPSVQQCRMQRQSFGPLYSMDIFANCGPIYISRSSIPRCSDLEELVTLCKGTLTDATYHAKIVVGEWVRYENVMCVCEKWVLDSITFNKKKSFKNYLLKQKS